MNRPTQHEATLPWTRERFEHGPSPSARLQTSVSLLVHAETVLGRQPGGAGQHRALTLGGNLHLPQLRAEIMFRRRGQHENGNGNGNGTGHSEASSAFVTIVPRLFTMAIPFQHLTPPTREESEVWALTREPNHDPAWVEHYAGRLGDAPFTFDQHFPVVTTFDLTFAYEVGERGRGGWVEVAGELRFERSIRVRLCFRDPMASMETPSEYHGDEADWIVAGSRIPIPRQTVSGLAGRDSRMTVRVIDANGRMLCAARSRAGLAPIAS